MANAVGGQQQGFWCAVCYGDSKKDKTFLLADLIIDKVLINKGRQYVLIPYTSSIRHVRRWFAYVIVNKWLMSVGADEMCGGGKHRY